MALDLTNKKCFESTDIIRSYSGQTHLQKPEKTILNSLKNELNDMNMLDLGVGCGRTTIHFAKLVKEYFGVDYSKHMIEACKKRFPEEEKISFKVADARSLREFKDDYFDLVLFSFNGLDYINHKDRIKALEEIKRVLKNGGLFVFSTHNLNCLNKLYSIYYSPNTIKLSWQILRYLILILLNGSPKKLMKNEWVIINDGAHGFRSKTYYIKPQTQIQQLKKLHFIDIKLYSLDNGKEISASNLSEINDSWIYYLCRI